MGLFPSKQSGTNCNFKFCDQTDDLHDFKHLFTLNRQPKRWKCKTRSVRQFGLVGRDFAPGVILNAALAVQRRLSPPMTIIQGIAPASPPSAAEPPTLDDRRQLSLAAPSHCHAESTLKPGRNRLGTFILIFTVSRHIRLEP